MNPISITVTGRLGDDPRTFTTRDGTDGVELRLALDIPARGAGEGITRWIKVTAFGLLATRTGESVRKGDRVTVVADDLIAEAWAATGTGEPGHDLVGLDRVPDLLVGVVDGLAQGIDRGVAGHVVVEMGQRPDDDVAGDVAGGHAAHPIGNGKQPRPGVHGILVSVPDEPAVAARRITHGECHGLSSRDVRPMRIGTPRGTGVGAVTLARSRYVPLVEPRSSTNHCPDRGTSRACRAEA
jgi:hypothetical protein